MRLSDIATAFVLLHLLLILSTEASQASSRLKKDGGLHVGLHAQVSPSQGFVVGSVITTAGLQRAFAARREVSHVKTFYPFEYEGLHEDAPWDLIIIEGWFQMINAFIHEVRAVSPQVVILFYCLDPDFPGLHVIKALDVDGFLTNSRLAEMELSAVAPTHHLLLAADPDMPRCNTQTRHKYSYLNDKVVFVGSAVGMYTKALLPHYLRQAAAFDQRPAAYGGLALLGKGWDEVPEFAPYWHGVLPQEDLCCAYSSALAILGVTMDGQRAAGMINNRVFEALACASSSSPPPGGDRGGPARRLITEPFPEQEEVFGDDIRYLRDEGDMERHIADLLINHTHPNHYDEGGGEESSTGRLLREQHSYHQRVQTIMDFVANTTFKPASRQGRLRVLLLHEAGLHEQVEYRVTLGPALQRLEVRGLYHFTYMTVPTNNNGGPPAEVGEEEEAGEVAATLKTAGRVTVESTQNFDAIWAVSDFGGAADTYLRTSLSREETTMTTPRGMSQRRALILWGGEPHPSLPATDEDHEALRRHYDVIMYKTEWDRAALRHPNLQHAYGVLLPSPTSPSQSSSSSSEGSVVVLMGPDANLSSWPLHHHLAPPSSLTNTSTTTTGMTTSPSLGGGVTLACLEGACPSTAAITTSQHHEDDDAAAAAAPRMHPVADLLGLGRVLGASSTTSLTITGQGLPLWALVGAAALLGRDHDDDETAARSGSSTSGSPSRREVLVWGLEERMTHVVRQWPEAWDADYYARMMTAAMTRTMCLGRGDSSIHIISPRNYTTLHTTTTATSHHFVRVRPSLHSFSLGQDGSWCLLACQRLVLCIQRDDIDLILDIKPPPHRPALLELTAQLRSNMYRDIIATSPPVFILVAPPSSSGPPGEEEEKRMSRGGSACCYVDSSTAKEGSCCGCSGNATHSTRPSPSPPPLQASPPVVPLPGHTIAYQFLQACREGDLSRLRALMEQ